MEVIELWLMVKGFFIYLVQYGFPTIALIISVFSFRCLKQVSEIQYRLDEAEKKLKIYELEKKEKERKESIRANVEARIINISKDNYKMKIWNSGKSTAYNIDFNIPEEYKNNVDRSKVPYEFLEPGKSFEEIVIVYGATPYNFRVTTTWNDEDGDNYINEQIVSV